uniref:Uncharacterized protein n=1 Tax=Rhizophora mucronata TaxID=61149 RepID=A0A2P2Q5E6_RHIMU
MAFLLGYTEDLIFK